MRGRSFDAHCRLSRGISPPFGFDFDREGILLVILRRNRLLLRLGFFGLGCLRGRCSAHDARNAQRDHGNAEDGRCDDAALALGRTPAVHRFPLRRLGLDILLALNRLGQPFDLLFRLIFQLLGLFVFAHVPTSFRPVLCPVCLPSAGFVSLRSAAPMPGGAWTDRAESHAHPGIGA